MANNVISGFRPPVYEYIRDPDRRVTVPGGSDIIPGGTRGPFLVDPGSPGSPPPGGIPPSVGSTVVNVTTANGTTAATDTRVKIKVPAEYLTRMTRGGGFEELTRNGGIIFPYTPSISYEHKADFSPLAPIHSNYPVYFYQRSSVTPISIQGKFTVQNENDAAVYASTVHLLRALTKMRSGDDPSAGSPPPVCRLFAYGLFMLDNVPVSISSVKIELPESVDYFSAGDNPYSPGVISVPTLSTISVTCIPMYSRSEMQNFTVPGWLNNESLRRSGLL